MTTKNGAKGLDQSILTIAESKNKLLRKLTTYLTSKIYARIKAPLARKHVDEIFYWFRKFEELDNCLTHGNNTNIKHSYIEINSDQSGSICSNTKTQSKEFK